MTPMICVGGVISHPCGHKTVRAPRSPFTYVLIYANPRSRRSVSSLELGIGGTRLKIKGQASLRTYVLALAQKRERKVDARVAMNCARCGEPVFRISHGK